MRALLIPQTQLPGKLRILIDARFDLQRPVHQPGLGKVVHHRRAIVLAVAAAGDPADQVVPVGRGEGQNLDKLRARLARQLHQHKVRLHGLSDLFAAFAHAGFGGHGPQVFAVVKDLRVGHVIKAVHLGLQLEQKLGIAHMLAQIGRHGRRILEQAGEDASIGRQDGVLKVEDVEGGGSVVGIDDRLDAVAHVVHGLAVNRVMRRVGVAVRLGKRIENPRQASVVAQDNVRISVEGEERRQGRDPVPHFAPHQEAAVRVDIVAEGQLAQVAAIERDQDAAQETAQLDAAVALVRGANIGVALWVIELLLVGLDVDIGRGLLAEVDFGPGNVEALHGALHRHVAQQQRGQAFGREPVDGVHGDAIAVGIDELVVDPVAAALGELVHVEFAGRQHHLALGAVDGIAIDIDVGKVVVGADLLDLAQRILERTPVPQANVLKGGLIVGRVGGLDGGLGGKLALREPVQPIGLTGHLDVMGNEGLFENQRVGFDPEAADVPAHQSYPGVTDDNRNQCGNQPASAGSENPSRRGDGRTQQQRRTGDQHAGDSDVRIGIGDAVEDRMVLEEQTEAAEIHPHGDDEQQEGNRDGDPAPGQHQGAAAPRGQGARPAGNEQKHGRNHAADDAERQQPAEDELPGRKRKEIEVQRPAEDGIDRAACCPRRVPPERQRLPLGGHRGARGNGDEQRPADAHQAQHRLDGEIQRLAG